MPTASHHTPPVRRLALVLLAGAALAVSACATKDTSRTTDAKTDARTDANKTMTAEDQAAEVLVKWAKALASGDPDGACELMTSRAQKDIVELVGSPDVKTCRDVLKLVRAATDKSELAEFRHLKITSVKIDGSIATVSTASDATDGPTTLRRVEGKWLLDT